MTGLLNSRFTQMVTEDVADVDWNDDRDVILTIWTKHRRPKRRTLTRDQARELGTALIAVADTAESASAGRTEPESARFDLVEHIGPDCRDGKHAACIGDAWSVEDDGPKPCSCLCHRGTTTTGAAS